MSSRSSIFYSENTYTITAYAEIYCGDKITERSVIQSMLGIGAVFGVFFINIVSDLRGRKFSLLIAMFFGVLSSLRNYLSIQC